MNLEDLFCPCGASVEPVQDDAGVFVRCSEGCQAVTAGPAPSVRGAVVEWLAALPAPSPADALEGYIQASSAALVHAQTPQELIALAPVARVLVAYLQSISHRPAGG